MLRMKKKKEPTPPPPQSLTNHDVNETPTTPSTTAPPADDVTTKHLLYPPITVPLEAKFTIAPHILQLFEEQPVETDRLLTAWPLTITNVAQQRGQVKIQFQIPKVVGQYTYYLHIHSTDFLGAHQDLEFQMNVVPRPKPIVSTATTLIFDPPVVMEVEDETKKEK